MNGDAKHYRTRATDCRNLAKGARNWADRSILEDLAAELEDEANRIDDEEERGPSPRPANEP